MFRRLIWVMLTLPLAACVVLWVSSYWHYAVVGDDRESRHFGIAVAAGCAQIFSSSAPGIAGGGWYFEHGQSYWDGEVKPHLFPGFRVYEMQYPLELVFQVPMWSVALLAALPPLWFFRRQRKHRKIGFPVSPAAERK